MAAQISGKGASSRERNTALHSRRSRPPAPRGRVDDQPDDRAVPGRVTLAEKAPARAEAPRACKPARLRAGLIGGGQEDAGLPNRLGQVKAGARQAFCANRKVERITSRCYAVPKANRFRCLNWLNSFGIFAAYKL